MKITKENFYSHCPIGTYVKERGIDHESNIYGKINYGIVQNNLTIFWLGEDPITSKINDSTIERFNKEQKYWADEKVTDLKEIKLLKLKLIQ